MAKLLPINKVVYEQVENVRCDHCEDWINDTEHLNANGYLFWCSECVANDFKLLYEVLKSIDDKFQYLPTTYHCYPEKADRKYQYYWWAGGEHINKIKAIPKGTPAKVPTYTGLMIRESTDGRYCWHSPKESAEVIKPSPMIFINEPFSFLVRWSDGTQDTFVDGVRQ